MCVLMYFVLQPWNYWTLEAKVSQRSVSSVCVCDEHARLSLACSLEKLRGGVSNSISGKSDSIGAVHLVS